MSSASFREELYKTTVRGVRFALRLPDRRWSTRLVERFFGRFLANIIDVAATYDQMIADTSINEASLWISGKCGTPAEVVGAENVPADGPVLLVSNHPGYFEGMLTIAHLPREDIRIVVGGIPYFNHLPNTSKLIYYTDHSAAKNIEALRHAVRHLQSGGIFLIYPTGQADPDPDSMPGSMARIDDWSESVALMLRRVPDTTLVPVIVSGIVDPRYLHHPLALLAPERRARIRAAELFQMYRQFIDLDNPPISRPRLSFGKPFSASSLGLDLGKAEIMSRVKSHARELLDAHMDRLAPRSSVWV